MMLTRPWAKVFHNENGRVIGWHSLVDHSADVAACFEALVNLPIPAARLAALAGRTSIPPIWAARLCAHVALHDFGKVNSGFQARERLNAEPVGHCREAFSALRDRKGVASRLESVLPWREMRAWGAFEQARLTMLAHHGRPVNPDKYDANDLQRWSAADGYDPVAALASLGSALRRWFPQAFVEGGEPLPDSAALWHAVSGYVTLADWLGSDEDYFPYANGESADRMSFARERAARAWRDIEFDPSGLKTPQALARADSFACVSAFSPRPMQFETSRASGNLVILESETGSGKTEAALWRFARLFAAGAVDGLYFALPTRVAATSLHGRVGESVTRLFPDPAHRPRVTLAVPGLAGATGDGVAGLLGASPDVTESPIEARREPHWAAERPKRFLAGTIAVGTIDQALLGAIQAKHAHLRLSSLLRHLLVVDEVHASDVYMSRLLGHLLAFHRRAGGHALLLSATLGASARAKLLSRRRAEPPPLEEAITAPYPALSSDVAQAPAAQPENGRERRIALTLEPYIADTRTIAERAIEAARRGAKVLVVRNLRRDAVAVFNTIREISGDELLLSCAGVATPHHGRFAREDRTRLDRAVEAALGRERAAGGLIVVGTQTLEQSLDIDADYLVTDLCPADVLLQRLGRLHRHSRGGRADGFETPRARVLAPAEMDSLLERGAHGLGFFSIGGRTQAYPYPDLVGVEATRRAIIEHPTWTIPQMNRLLVETATHPEARERLLTQLDERWRDADIAIDGRNSAHSNEAAQAFLRYDKSFTDSAVVFPRDESFSSRLGAKDLLVTFDPSVTGPFGGAVRQIAIPDYWAHGIDPTKEMSPHILARLERGFSFAVQGVEFNYDNRGLASL